ncbi:MAG: hypothetical protein ACYTGZ_14510 [Planctomycetota bacterium]
MGKQQVTRETSAAQANDAARPILLPSGLENSQRPISVRDDASELRFGLPLTRPLPELHVRRTAAR